MPFPCCCKEPVCTCDEPVSSWRPLLSDNAWTWTRLRYQGGRLELSENGTNVFASGTQVATGLLPGADYVLYFDVGQGDFGYWVQINSQTAYSADGVAWEFAEDGIYSLDVTGGLRFTAPGTSVTIRVGLTSATSRLASDFPRVTGTEGQGNVVNSICLCSICTVQVTNPSSCSYTASIVSQVPASVTQFQWQVRLCALTEFVVPSCTQPLFSGNTSTPNFSWSFSSPITGARRGGNVQVTMRDANNQIVAFCQTDFLPQCNVACCRNGLPDELQVTSSGWTPKLGPFNTVIHQWQIDAASHLNASHTCDLVHVAGTASSPVYRYHGPPIELPYTGLSSRVPAEWGYKSMALARAELNCGLNAWLWSAEVVFFADFLTEAQVEALLSNAITAPSQYPPSWQQGVDELIGIVDTTSKTGTTFFANANCNGITPTIQSTFETNRWFLPGRTATLVS